MAIRTMPIRTLARVLDAAYGMMGFVTAVQRDDQLVPIDWTHRIDVIPAAKEALGAAFCTAWARTLLARILDTPLDMDARHFSCDGESFVARESLRDSGPSNRLILVSMPDGKIDLVITCGDATVAGVRNRVQKSSNLTLILSSTGRTLHDTEIVSYVCEDETFAVEARDDNLIRWSDLMHEHRCGNTPRITAELMLPLCWACPGRQPTVWRRREALGAVAVARHAGIVDVLPLILKHLALPPRDWLRGPNVAGHVYRTTEGDTVTFTFVPDVQLSCSSRLRLRIEGGGEWFDA